VCGLDGFNCLVQLQLAAAGWAQDTARGPGVRLGLLLVLDRFLLVVLETGQHPRDRPQQRALRLELFRRLRHGLGRRPDKRQADAGPEGGAGELLTFQRSLECVPYQVAGLLGVGRLQHQVLQHCGSR